MKRISMGVKRLDDMLVRACQGISVLFAAPRDPQDDHGHGIPGRRSPPRRERRHRGVREDSAWTELPPRPHGTGRESGHRQHRALDLSIDATLYELTEAIHRLKAKPS